MKKRLLLIFAAGLLAVTGCSQTVVPSELQYLHGLRIQGALSCNVRGVEITVTPRAGSIAAGRFHKVFPEFSIRSGYKAIADSSLGLPAVRIDHPQSGRAQPRPGDVAFFVQKSPDSMVGLLIQSIDDPGQKIGPALLRYLVENGVPDSLLSELGPPVVMRLAGRSISIGKGCRWTGPSTLQCTRAGELNWSLYPDSVEAAALTAQQASFITEQKIGEPETAEDVQLLFEGTSVTARRVRYRIKGAAGLLTKAGGSNQLVIYFVNALVRGRYLGCVLSHWTSDRLGEKGLPPLLGEVMELR